MSALRPPCGEDAAAGEGCPQDARVRMLDLDQGRAPLMAELAAATRTARAPLIVLVAARLEAIPLALELIRSGQVHALLAKPVVGADLAAALDRPRGSLASVYRDVGRFLDSQRKHDAHAVR